VVELAGLVADKITGVDHEVRRQVPHAPEGAPEIGVIDVDAHMDIADLDERLSLEIPRKIAERQAAFGELDPMGFDEECIGGRGPASSRSIGSRAEKTPP
jgi:hypothetical protein